MRITKQDAKEGEIRLFPENTEDLWHIERILQPGDRIVAKSFRRFKPSEKDAGEKKLVTIKLLVEKAEFSPFANRLRASGKIIEGTPEEFVQQGAYHTIDIEANYPVSIIKDSWQSFHLSRLKQAIAETKRPRLGILVIDESKAIYATLRGYGVEYELEVESKASKRDADFDSKRLSFFSQLLQKLSSSPVEKIIIAGPGFTAENFLNFVKQQDPSIAKKAVLEHCSYAERTGINELLKRGVVSKIAKEERAAKELALMGRFSSELMRDSGLAAYGMKDVQAAVESSAAETILVLDELLRNSKEVAKIVEEAEKRKVEIVIFSDKSDGGRELAGYGGLAALLRFRIS